MTTKNPGPTYPSLSPWELEPHYSRRVSAMTAEALHSKAAIAEQLAWRDQTIEGLRARIADQELALSKANIEIGRLAGMLDGQTFALPLNEHPKLVDAKALGEAESKVIASLRVVLRGWGEETSAAWLPAVRLAMRELDALLALRAERKTDGSTD